VSLANTRNASRRSKWRSSSTAHFHISFCITMLPLQLRPSYRRRIAWYHVRRHQNYRWTMSSRRLRSLERRYADKEIAGSLSIFAWPKWTTSAEHGGLRGTFRDQGPPAGSSHQNDHVWGSERYRSLSPYHLSSSPKSPHPCSHKSLRLGIPLESIESSLRSLSFRPLSET